MKIGKRFTFDAAHQLPNHDGKCKYLHGHTYTVEVVIHGRIRGVLEENPASDEGMVVDFGLISTAVKKLIDDYCDHKFLNDTLPVPRTTAEWISAWLFDEIYKCVLNMGGSHGLDTVRVQEGEGGWAECDYASWEKQYWSAKRQPNVAY